MRYILFTTAFSIWMSMYWVTGGTLASPQFQIELCRAISFGLCFVIGWTVYAILHDHYHYEGDSND